MSMLAGANLWSSAVNQGASGPGRLASVKILYSVGNTVRQMSPDLTEDELLFTWAGETEIGGIAVDHQSERIFLQGGDTMKVIYINYDGSGETLFRQTSAATGAGVATPLSISEKDNLIFFRDTGGSGLGSLVSMPLAGGSVVTLWADIRSVSYAPEIDKLITTGDAGTPAVRVVDMDGGSSVSHGSQNDIRRAIYYGEGDAIFIGNNNGGIKTVPRGSTTHNSWFYEIFIRWWQMEIDVVNDHLWVMAGRGSDVDKDGVWKFTDPSTWATSSAHGATADMPVTPKSTDKNLGLAIKYNQPWQAFVAE